MTPRHSLPFTPLCVLLLGLIGCESRPTADQIVAIDQIPPNLMEIARKELPGITFEIASKFKVDGKDAYEIRGKNKQGKVREVEISTTGEVLEIE